MKKLIIIILVCSSCSSFKGPSFRVVTRHGRLTPEEVQSKKKREEAALIGLTVFFAGVGLINLDR